jgi:iron complex transport system substrate-binding protein
VLRSLAIGAIVIVASCLDLSAAIREVDDLDITVTLATAPQRIVSLSPSNTELLFALGVGDNLVGVTAHCNYPPAAERIEEIGAFKTLSIEKMLSLEPDLVVAIKGNALESLETVRSFDIPVFALNIGSVQQLLEAVSRLGRLTGRQQAADSLRAVLSGRLDGVKANVKKRARRPRMMWGHWGEPIFTAGRNTYIDDVLELAGGENLGRRAPGAWPQISLEAVVSWAPEILITTMDFTPERRAREIRQLRQRDGWKSIPAVARDGIVFLEADLLLRPGPRVFDALEKLVAEVDRRDIGP